MTVGSVPAVISFFVIARSLRRSKPYLPCLPAYGLPRPFGLAMTFGSLGGCPR